MYVTRKIVKILLRAGCSIHVDPNVIFYALLMKSTLDHEHCIMYIGRPRQKLRVNYCFIKLLGIFLPKD